MVDNFPSGSRGLSPSAIAKFLDCPQKYKLSYVDGVKEPPSWQMYLGSFVHEVLEQLYKRPAEARTQESLKDLAAHQWADRNWQERIEGLPQSLGSLGDFKRAAYEAMTNLWMLEDPSRVQLNHVEIEIAVSIEGVKVFGIVDRIASDPDGSVVISDYKTGKIPDQRFTSDSKKWFQLLLYAAMYNEKSGKLAKRLEYLYLAQNAKHVLEVSDEHVQNAKDVVVRVRRSIDAASASGEFLCNVTNLCNWCHYKKSGLCPAHARSS